ncbi:hypothetical protein ACE6H2_004772 [Prunus campanulata]
MLQDSLPTIYPLLGMGVRPHSPTFTLFSSFANYTFLPNKATSSSKKNNENIEQRKSFCLLLCIRLLLYKPKQ